MAFAAEYHNEGRWQGIERYLNGADRMEWLSRHEKIIRPLVEEAKAEHVACYGEGWLKRALGRIAEQCRCREPR